MKKLFGILTAGAVALSLTACGDEETPTPTPTYEWKDGTGVAYTLDMDLIQKATVTVTNDVFEVEFDGYYTFARSGLHLPGEYTKNGVDVTGYATTPVDHDNDVDTAAVDVFTYIEVDSVLYTFDNTAFTTVDFVDNTLYGDRGLNYAYLNAYENAEGGTLLDYEKTITTNTATGGWTGTEAAASAFIDLYESYGVKVFKDAEGTDSILATGSYGHLNKSDEASSYWDVADGLGWEGNIAKIEEAFESDHDLFEVDFTTTTDTDLAGATVGNKYSYANTITLAYDKLEKN